MNPVDIKIGDFSTITVIIPNKGGKNITCKTNIAEIENTYLKTILFYFMDKICIIEIFIENNIVTITNVYDKKIVRKFRIGSIHMALNNTRRQMQQLNF